MTGLDLIAQERQRQIASEGWTADHDDGHIHDELAIAAMCYAAPMLRGGGVPASWPWEREWWKPGPNRVRELTKAGALIVAEIDRLIRSGASTYPDTSGTAPEKK